MQASSLAGLTSHHRKWLCCAHVGAIRATFSDVAQRGDQRESEGENPKRGQRQADELQRASGSLPEWCWCEPSRHNQWRDKSITFEGFMTPEQFYPCLMDNRTGEISIRLAPPMSREEAILYLKQHYSGAWERARACAQPVSHPMFAINEKVE